MVWKLKKLYILPHAVHHELQNVDYKIISFSFFIRDFLTVWGTGEIEGSRPPPPYLQLDWALGWRDIALFAISENGTMLNIRYIVISPISNQFGEFGRTRVNVSIFKGL